MQKPHYLKETKHNSLRRAVWHNYYDRAIYMVTISKHKSCPDFGTLRYTFPDDAHVSLSPLGCLLNYQIEITPKYNPEVVILDKIIMPDHAHILINVVEPIEKHLGDIIQAIKAATTSAFRRELDLPDLTVFDEGFHDRIVKDHHQLDTLYRYLRENPYRLAVRRANPYFFRRVERLKIGGTWCQAYGNMQLLDNPFKEQVVVHRADLEAVRSSNRDRWFYTAVNGGVLVSPFISPAEKAVRSEAEALGARIILISSEPMHGRYKPTAAAFALCTQGRLLIVAPENLSSSEILSRDICLYMNALAAEICKA